MTLTNDFFEKLAELQTMSKAAGTETVADVELYPNRYEQLKVDRPFYLQNVFIAEASDADDLKVLREKKRAQDPDDMIEKAHPKPVYMSSALGDGGLVENQNEQHDKMLQVVWKLPGGNHIHIAASEILVDLVKLANDLDEKSPEAAALVDETIAVISGREAERRPELTKEALWPLAAGIVALVAGLGYSAYQAIKGIQENLQVDTRDLVQNIASWKDDPEYATQRALSAKIYAAATQLSSLSAQLMSASAAVAAHQNPEAQQAANQADAQFEQLLSSIEHTAPTIEQNLGGIWASFNGKLEDVRQGYNMMHAQIAGGAQQAGTREKEAPPTGESAPTAPTPTHSQPDPHRISAIQQYLSKIGFQTPLTGQSDGETKSSLVQLERHLNETTEGPDGQLHRGLGLRNLPGNRLSGLLDSTLTATQLEALVGIFENPAAHVA